MKKIICAICVSLFAGILPLHAQWQRGARAFKNIPRTPKLATRMTLAARHAERQAALRTRMLENQTKFRLKKSTLLVENPQTFSHWENLDATAFVIAETYKGKTQLWGVSASHYRFEAPVLTHPLTQEKLPIVLVAQGSYGFNDVTLFPIPESIQPLVTPLPLATQPVELGDELHSVGYFDDEFQLEEHRKVTAVSPHRIITSLQVEDKLSREGACGGPVLNQRDEVVGVHVGSSDYRQVGFVIPVEHIREVLYAYHHNGHALRTLRFNGQELGQIDIDEYLNEIEVWKGNKLLRSFVSYHNKRVVDYEHLETLIDTSDADRIVLSIEKSPFSMTQPDQLSHTILITYDLRSQTISREEE